MTHLPHLTAAVLAGGKSTRFGEPKAFALVDNRTLLEIALAIGFKISAQRMLIMKQKTSLEDHRVACYEDILKNCGPLAGIYTALVHSVTNWVAIIPCDMPLLSPSLYQFLYKFCSIDRPVAAVSETGMEPLVSIWPQSCRDGIITQLTGGKYNVRKCLDYFDAAMINLPDLMPKFSQHMFSNINYKSDLTAIIQEMKIGRA